MAAGISYEAEEKIHEALNKIRTLDVPGNQLGYGDYLREVAGFYEKIEGIAASYAKMTRKSARNTNRMQNPYASNSNNSNGPNNNNNHGRKRPRPTRRNRRS